MARDEFRHLEHAHLALAVKNRPERVVGIDLSALGFVLKTVLLNIIPQLLRELRTGQWFRTNDSGELVIRLNWSHEGGIGLAF